MILRVIAKLLIPTIMLFALYVQFHGDYGPGGGFQAGVIFASALILYSLIYGVRATRNLITSHNLIRVLCASGLLLYICVGIAGLLLGANFLDYSVLSADPVHGQHLGILLIELGVGITVATGILAIFLAFAEREREDENNRQAD
jgi:multicomponent Na+:H+ antiporter subunit B